MPPPEHRGEDARRDEDTRRSESEESRHGPTRRSREALEDERQRGRRRTERSASRERPRDVSPSYADTNRKPSGRNDRRKCDVCGQMVGGGEFGYMNHCQTSKFHMTWKFHSRGLPWNQAAARANKEWHNLNPATSVPGSSVPPDRRSLSLRSVRPAEPARPPKRPRVPEPSQPRPRVPEPSQPPRRLQTASGRAPSQEERPKERFVGRSRSRKHDKDRTRRRRKSHGSRDTSRRRRRDRSKTPAEASRAQGDCGTKVPGKEKNQPGPGTSKGRQCSGQVSASRHGSQVKGGDPRQRRKIRLAGKGRRACGRGRGRVGRARVRPRRGRPQRQRQKVGGVEETNPFSRARQKGSRARQKGSRASLS